MSDTCAMRDSFLVGADEGLYRASCTRANARERPRRRAGVTPGHTAGKRIGSRTTTARFPVLTRTPGAEGRSKNGPHPALTQRGRWLPRMRDLVTLALAIGVLVAIPVLVWLLLTVLGVDFSP